MPVISDVHITSAMEPVDWDIEAMNQTGRIGSDDIEAWALGSLVGRTMTEVMWSPRLGIQVDAASGNKNPGDNQHNTFNPLFQTVFT